jgi:NAD(P)-dependent dehydrogenase (short-subunit alcohol dehydrogenase family)
VSGAEAQGAGRVALVTGTASGIGRATALRFLEAGYAVAALDRDAGGLESLAGESPDAGRTLILVADLTDEEATGAALDRALDWKDRLDAVINVAGLSPPEEFSEYTKEDWAPLVQTNVRGMFVVCQKTAPALARSGEGAIVNVSSILARVADPTLIAYGATKGAVSALTRALAMKLAPEVRVNAVCPGDVATPGLEAWIAGHPDPDGVRKRIENSYPLRRICAPEDVAEAILFLAGPTARMITGQELVLDGGLTVKVY